MHILIVGGTRFLGAAVARELVTRGHRVSLLHRGTTSGNVPPEAEHLLGDARDRAFVESVLQPGRFDAVVDTILTSDDLQWYLPLLHKTVGQLVHCGSTGVYAPMTTVPAREYDPTPCAPELGGFAEKLAQDRVLLEYHEHAGFQVCSLRVSNVFGAGDVPLDIWGARNPQYFQRLADGEEIWLPGDGTTLLQPVHVDDLARGFRAAVEAPSRTTGQIFNLSSDRAVTLTRYAELAAELLGSASMFRCVPMEEILATGRANEAGLRFICEHMCIDSSKAGRVLHYEPKVSVREGLRDSLTWMIDTGRLRAERPA
ncbi:MAG TPA: NAD-dependent epimerase/dehydratase family protein [Candidatus Hydrogenedentes bacterium]|mgnify:CR=1 FL=1|jgi:nucleoside-diphosphate-sugar epimerase|nr:NAD-dependent epimerase/dehydratase family protein [Candidatus Hydrogenedentota bacterium]HPJ98352.1 NAD-dependent epimerase/dehydratase family protein [Candidatus Hydrogenedentota bacterium]